MGSTLSQKILKSIREGDTKHYLQVLYDKEYPKIRKYIISNNGGEDEAKDIFQESLMTLISHVKLGKYKEEYEVGGFLFTISRNQWRKRAPKIKDSEEISETHTYSYSPYSDLFDNERKNIINGLLTELGENCKRILVATLFNNMSLKEVAEQYGYANDEAVKTRNYKCKKRLGKLIGQKPQLEQYLKESLYG